MLENLPCVQYTLKIGITMRFSGIKVTLVEKENAIAPTTSRLRHQDDRAVVEQMVQAAQANDLIDILKTIKAAGALHAEFVVM